MVFRATLPCLSVVVLAAAAMTVAAQDDPGSKPAAEQHEYESTWMMKKLEMSQQIMEGLARGDLDVVQQSATTMRTLSRIEGWARRRDTREYRRQLKFFDQSNTAIIRQAKNDNLNGATLAFTQMTLSCVACHQHLRDEPQATP